MRERLATNGGESSVLGRARFASRTAEKIKKGSLTLSKFYVAHIPPLEGWYSRDSLCYGVGARVAYITAKAAKKKS